MFYLTQILSLDNIAIISSLITIVFAMFLIQISLTKYIKHRKLFLLLPLINSIFYIILSLDWIIYSSFEDIGHIKDIIWNVIEMLYVYCVIILIEKIY